MAAQEMSARVIPPEMGGGRIKLYPVVVGTESVPVVNAAEVEGFPWLLVIFKERVAIGYRTKRGALSKLRGWRDCAEIMAIIGMRKSDPKGKKSKKKAPARVRVCEAAPKNETAKPPAEPEKTGDAAPPEDQEKSPEITAPKFAEGTTLDDALNQCFPLEWMMSEFARLAAAETPVFDKEGNQIGSKPEFYTQFTVVKSLLEYREGKAREREKSQEKAKRISYDELKGQLVDSEEACKFMESLIRGARDARDKGKKAAGGKAKTE